MEWKTGFTSATLTFGNASVFIRGVTQFPPLDVAESAFRVVPVRRNGTTDWIDGWANTSTEH
jgi:hypothetical protein